MKLVLVTVFGIVGVLARYGIGVALGGFSEGFPLHTFIINILGCFLIGVIYVLGVEKSVLSLDMRVGLMVGLLGGFTTFSAYSLEAALLINMQKFFLAALYFFASGFAGLAGVYLGFWFARSLT